MAFPEDRMPIRVRAAFGADAEAAPSTWPWTDITADVNAQQVTITRGQANEGGEPSPTSISLVLDNPHGNYTPDNALSDYYPNVDQGVPLEYSIGASQPYMRLEFSTSRATTPDAAQVDVTGDLDVRLDCALDTWQARPGSLLELCGKYAISGDQRSWLLVLGSDGTPIFRWSTDGVSVLQVGATAQPSAPSTGRLALRVTLDVDNGTGGHTLTFYTAPTIDAENWTQLGDPVTGSGTTSVFNSTAPLTAGDIQILGFDSPVGNYYAMQLRNGIDGTLVADVDFTAQTVGATTFTDSTGLQWTLANGAEITEWQRRFIGHIDSWEPVWPYGDLSRTDANGELEYEGESQVTITASGILRRLGQGEEPLQSTLRRRIPSFNPVAYWPQEEGRNATSISSPIEGVAAFTPTGFDFAADDTLPGSSPLPSIAATASFAANVPPATPGVWQVELVYFLEAMPASLTTLFEVRATGTGRRVRVRVATDNVTLQGFDANDNELFLSSTLAPQFTGAWNRLQIKAVPDGGNVTYVARWIVIGGSGFAAIATIAGSAGYATQVSSAFGSGLEGLRFGHLAVFDTETDAPFNAADMAFNGENAADRMIRLCQEEGIPFVLTGDATTTQAMGPQRPATLTDLLAECAAVDGGLLGEQRASYGLAYRTRASLYNQTPRLVLDAAQNEITNPFAPVLDDQRLRNYITVSREGGSSATAVDEASVMRRRQYKASVTVNAFSDDQLPALAGWRLHLGTWPGMRYPSVSTELSIAPQLITDWLELDYGDRLHVVNLPPQHPRDTVDLLLQGYSETISPTRWTVQANCSPGGPWTVGAVALAEDFSDSTYAFPITAGGNLPWFRSQAHYNSASWSLRSGAIGNNQTSDAIVTVPTGATALTFWYWTSSEEAGPGFEGDRLLVLVDGVQVLRAQGITPWTQTTIDVTGKSAVTFRYAKDNSAAAGEDAVYIDDLVFTMPAPSRVDANPGASTLALASTDTATQLLVHTPARGVGKNPVPWITSAGVAPTYPQDFPLDIRFGGEVARLQKCEPVAWDTFTRTVANGWGTASSGLSWVDAGGVASDRSVNGSAGVLTLAANRDTVRFERIVGNIADCEVLTRVSVDQVATGAALLPAILLRYTDPLNFYRARLHFGTSGTMAVSVTRGTTTIGTTPAIPYPYSAGQWFWLRARLTGHRVQMRAWPDGRVEPGEWHADQTITTDPISSGQVGVAGSAFSTNTNTNPQLRYDDFRIPTPQLMTVERSRNGVVKAHAVGTEVRVDRPAVIAL
ncbi:MULTISPECIES: hypothetical protein [unclassified Streptomyces]|uniref:hypothetical protein n=1 Tax=unclassified Streptomyces TaxID=2593676 RepID=UPI0014889E5F|nr:MULTISPECIES: hypothetical protein [unclassified Streptomyces]